MSDEVESKVKSLLVEVASRVKGSGEEIRQSLLEKLINKELTERLNLLESALQKRDQLFRELKKIDRPDQIVCDRNGNEIPGKSTYSKKRAQEIKKASDAFSKMDACIERALSKNEFDKLREAHKS